MRTFDAIRTAGPVGTRGSAGEELVRATQDLFQIRQAGRGVMVRPNGTYNFVRVAGETRNMAQTLVSAKSGHAAIAGGRPVLFAGTVRFDNGALEWWSNYSGTYQPVAAFRQQAGLPDDRFTPWQKLQMGGVGMQRGTFLDRRDVGRPDSSTRQSAPAGASGREGGGRDTGSDSSAGDASGGGQAMSRPPTAPVRPTPAAARTEAGGAPKEPQGAVRPGQGAAPAVTAQAKWSVRPPPPPAMRGRR